jgi:hypothetical protein
VFVGVAQFGQLVKLMKRGYDLNYFNKAANFQVIGHHEEGETCLTQRQQMPVISIQRRHSNLAIAANNSGKFFLKNPMGRPLLF